MKFACFFGILLFFTTAACAQDITGIWRGHFFSGYGIYQQQYKYEVQVDQLNSRMGIGSPNPIKGVTYSYRLTSFYGKARFVGIYNKKEGILTLKEDTLVELKMDGAGFSCLMTCYLQYHKEGSKEILEGTFSSVVSNTGKDCGSGTVYLERVEESDFHKEHFLLKKKPRQQDIASNKPPANKQPGEVKTPAPARPQQREQGTVKKTTPPAQKQLPKTTPQKKRPPVVKQNTPAKKAPAANNSAAKKDTSKTAPPLVRSDSTLAKVVPAEPVMPPPQQPIIKQQLPPVPDVIKQRENPLVKTIVTSSPDILIELYDNGEVDGDTITVYHNNQVVALKKGLNTKPITIKVTATPNDNYHEFVMVANNLGSIPPNTALMVVRTGGKRYELFISSNEQKNARVVINYQPPGNQ
ncbi:MAG TPA: hypothetical protein VHB48_05705 [Chitinophagaceae bacterium]|nr:hypothetical protein [Chitinophagaceae bacterium]